MSDRETRSLELEQTVDASPEEVWQALSTSDGLERWFPLEARVVPGEGGSVWLSWGPGCEGEAPLHVWDPPNRIGWTESHGTDDEGRPIRVAVDFHVEGRGGSTVVRIVQSGFGASADWDQMYDAVKDGWTYFLFNLAFYFREHRGRSRRMVWRRQPTELPREEAWNRLVGAGLVTIADGAIRLEDLHPAEVVSSRENHHFAAVVPNLGNAVWFVELEGRHVGLWLSIYDEEGLDVDGLQAALDAHAGTVLGSAA